MPVITAEILCPWEKRIDPAGWEYNAPALGELSPRITWEDMTGQDAVQIPPDPNLLVVKIEADESALEQIASDPGYHLLWSNSADSNMPRETRASNAECLSLRQFIIDRGGLVEDLDSVIGNAPGNGTRHQLSEDLKAWLRSRPRATVSQSETF